MKATQEFCSAPRGTNILQQFGVAESWLPFIGAEMIFVLRSAGEPQTFFDLGGPDAALSVWVAEQQEGGAQCGCLSEYSIMSKPRRVDDALYVHFITFSCYHRRRLLDHDQPKRILLGVLNEELQKFEARCVGFVIMPDHVHALIWFSKTGLLSQFMQQWKGRSSKGIKEFLYRSLPEYAAEYPKTDPIWQVRFYSFEIYTAAKIEEKLNYMHMNPVRGGLVPTEWRWSSARWCIEGRTVGIPIQWVD